MDYTNSAAIGQVYDSPQTAPPPGDLPRLTERLTQLLGRAQMITAELNCHADRVHGGGVTGSAQAEKPRPVRSGALGAMEDILDSMEDQLNALHSAAIRNTRLA